MQHSLCVQTPDLSLGMERLATAAPDGNSTSSSLCFAAKSTARCCSFKGNRLIVNSTSNFILLIKICSNLKQGVESERKGWVWLFIHCLRRKLGFKPESILSPALTSLRSPASHYPALLCEHIRCTRWSAGPCHRIGTPSDNLLVAQMADSQQHQEPVGEYQCWLSFCFPIQITELTVNQQAFRGQQQHIEIIWHHTKEAERKDIVL